MADSTSNQPRSSRGNSLQIQAQQRQAKLAAHQLLPNLPILPLLSLHFYEEASNNARILLDGSHNYQEIEECTRRAFSHLASKNGAAIQIMVCLLNQIAIRDENAKEALGKSIGSDSRLLAADDIHKYLTQTPPAVIFKNIRSDEITWGIVNKGEMHGAEANELFVTMELIEALLDPRPPGMSVNEFEVRRTQQWLLYTTTIIHETMHCLTKYFFTHRFITPKMPSFEVDSTKLYGEAGATFERQYFGFILEVLVPRTAATVERRRLWNIQHVIGRFSGHSCTIPHATVLTFLNSVRKAKLWHIDPTELEDVPACDKTNGIRYRITGTAGDEEDEENSISDDSLVTIPVTFACPPRGIGLGLGICMD
ncbi:hypothetical protein C8R45DRAFT_950202 [Mycena sanguinolenta]|nr:hypothetical protein C8R45DRAFT_950202 [Mycena sanguinolenta]